MSTQVTADNFVLRLGKYKGMLCKDVAKISIIDEKSGIKKDEGLRYLKWLVQRDWFRQVDLVTQIIKEHEPQDENKKEEPKVENVKQRKVKDIQ